MIELAICGAACLVLVFCGVGMVTRIHYRITSHHLEIRLFGFCLRRLDLTDIDRISKHRSSWCEPWPNTLQTRKRILIIRRRSDRKRDLLITPEHRYVFRHRLKQAISKARGEPDAPVSREEQAEEAEERSDD